MAYANINPLFFAWKQQGLEYLLSDKNVTGAASLCSFQTNSNLNHCNNQLKSSTYGKSLEQETKKPTTFNQKANTRELPKKQQNLSNLNKEQEIITPNTQQPPKKTALSLPSAWRERFEKTVATPVLFSYLELGYDLYGKADLKRRERLINLIIRDLKQLPDTFSFWPVAIPDKNGLTPDPIAYWNGVRLLRTRCLVVFGEKSAQAAGLAGNSIVGNIFWQNNCQILIAPDLNHAFSNDETYHKMLQLLQRVLEPHMPNRHVAKNSNV